MKGKYCWGKIGGVFVIAFLVCSIGQAININEEKNKSVDWWPMFHHDLGHNGYSTSDAPDTNIIRWVYITDNWVHSSLAVADGKIYFGSFDKNVYCLDVMKGDMIWKYTTGGYVSSSPIIVDNRVYIGSNDNKFYCLDALTGKMIWSYTTGKEICSSPAVEDYKIYFTSINGNVYCLDMNTGKMIWSFATSSYIYSSPAVADGKVYIGSGDYENQGRGRLYCLDAMTGDVIWSFLTGSFSTRDSYIYSSPAVADGKVYFGSCDMNVYCLEAGTGDKIWSYLTRDWILSSPAIADGKVYIGSNDKKIYCFGNQPPEKPTITGESNGKTGLEYEYTFASTDPDGDNGKYCINWGDDAAEVWIGPYPSGAQASAKHIWSEKGNDTIKAKTRDVYGAESEWTTLEVSMPKTHIYNPIIQLIIKLLERFPLLEKILNLIL